MKRALAGSIVVLALLAAGCGRREFELSVEFDQAHGLAAGAPVVLRGVRIGTVEGVVLTPENKVLAQLAVDPEHCRRLTTQTRFRIRPAAGETGSAGTVLAVEPGAGTGEPLACGATVAGEPFSGPPFLDQAAGALREMVNGARRGAALLVENLEELIGAAPAERLRGRVEELRRAAGRTAGEELERLRREELPEVMDELADLVERLRRQGRREEAERIVETLRELAREYRLVPTPTPASGADLGGTR